MDLSDFYFFKNENLKIALYYRKIGKYKLGFTYLKKACHEDNDPQAHFLMGEVYNSGGFGVRENTTLSKRWYESSSQLGCTWAYASLHASGGPVYDDVFEPKQGVDHFTKAIAYKYQNGHLCFEHSKEAVKEGNVFAYRLLSCFFSQPGMSNMLVQGWKLGEPASHYHYVRDILNADSFEELINMSAKQKYSFAIRQLSHMYTKRKMFSKAFHWDLKLRLPCEATESLLKWQSQESFSSYSSDYKIGSWKFGYVMKNDPVFLQRCTMIVNGGGRSMLALYNSGSKKIRRAIFCFIWATKGILYKDLHFIIGKILWVTRKDYQIWEKVINGGLGN